MTPDPRAAIDQIKRNLTDARARNVNFGDAVAQERLTWGQLVGVALDELSQEDVTDDRNNEGPRPF